MGVVLQHRVLLGVNFDLDEDARTRTYLTEMRNEMASRLREERWQQIQEKLAKKKETHYKKWRKTNFLLGQH